MRRTVKVNKDVILGIITKRQNTFNCQIIDKSVNELSGHSLSFIGYTWDELHSTVLGKTEMQYFVYFTKNEKRLAYNIYKSAMERDERLFNLLSAAEDQIKERKERIEREKQLKDQMINSVSIGDIFVASWGYEQTNVDAYQVIGKKSKTVTLSEIRLSQVPGTEGYMSCQVMPIKDAFIDKNVTLKKLINSNGIKFSSYRYARKWDGISSYYNSWYA